MKHWLPRGRAKSDQLAERPAGQPDPERVAQAFGLGNPRGPLTPLGDSPPFSAWQLTCSEGPYFIKRIRADEPDWWRAYAERAMAYEQSALEAGFDMPSPFEPQTRFVGYTAHVDDAGPVRAYEWLDVRTLERDDDIADWVGRTLALLHSIEPSSALADTADPFEKWDREDYGLRTLDEWRSWFDDAVQASSELGQLGLTALDEIARANVFVEESLRHVSDVVITHKDVEPWNIAMSSNGPILVDWDWIGRDSAWLVAAWAAIAYGAHQDAREEPDADRACAVIRSYLTHGGQIASGPPWSMGRRVGLRLTRLQPLAGSRTSAGSQDDSRGCFAASERAAVEPARLTQRLHEMGGARSRGR